MGMRKGRFTSTKASKNRINWHSFREAKEFADSCGIPITVYKPNGRSNHFRVVSTRRFKELNLPDSCIRYQTCLDLTIRDAETR